MASRKSLNISRAFSFHGRSRSRVGSAGSDFEADLFLNKGSNGRNLERKPSRASKAMRKLSHARRRVQVGSKTPTNIFRRSVRRGSGAMPSESDVGFGNTEGYKPRRHKGSVAFSRGLKKLRTKTAKLAQSFVDSVMADNHKNDAKSSASSNRIMDPEVKAAYNELRRYGVANDLDDARVVLSTLQNFPDSAEIQYLGLNYLATIALQEPKGLVDFDAIFVIGKAFDGFPKNPKVAEHACVLIWNLATEKECFGPMLEGNIPEKVVSVLKKFTESPLKGAATSALHKACGAIKLLAMNSDCKRLLVELGAIPLVMNAFFHFCSHDPNDHVPQETCIGCLQNFCHGKNFENNSHFVFKARGPEMVVRSMMKFPKVIEIQKSGCAAIWNFSLGSKNTTNKKGDEDKSADDGEDVDALMTPKERRTELARVGGGTRCLAAMKEWKDDSRVVIRAMGALSSLLKDEDEEILKIVRDKVHKSPAMTQDLGVVNIYDLVMDAYSLHESSEDDIQRIGEGLLDTFDIEDTESTNRDLIEELKSRTNLEPEALDKSFSSMPEILRKSTPYVNRFHSKSNRSEVKQPISLFELDVDDDLESEFGKLKKIDDKKKKESAERTTEQEVSMGSLALSENDDDDDFDLDESFRNLPEDDDDEDDDYAGDL